ncbi:MAG: cation:proton antiporter [Proteobacteria bacterium]|nr:cation:proton antiporter [Pseudomonadota bacterium]
MLNFELDASVTQPLMYLGFLLMILVVPKALQRFRIPAPITCLLFGLLVSAWSEHTPPMLVVSLLSVMGISSLFLFAGLEVNIDDLLKYKWPIITHLLVSLFTLGICAWLGMHWMGLSWQAASLLALALLTPSTGFILESLNRLGLREEERLWVMLKAISAELLALSLLFITLQSNSVGQLTVSSGILLGMVLLLPLAFMSFARFILPYAPGSEFSFLVMIAIVAAYVTKELGVYYLVGAFLVGILARRVQERMPAIASPDTMHAVKLFASFFVPFYFFEAGMHVPAEALEWPALWIGLAITVVILPVRITILWLQRRMIFKESLRSTLNVSITLMPTLVFTLVLAFVLYERFNISATLYGGLLLYALLSTALPSFVLRQAIDFGLNVEPPLTDDAVLAEPGK